MPMSTQSSLGGRVVCSRRKRHRTLGFHHTRPHTLCCARRFLQHVVLRVHFPYRPYPAAEIEGGGHRRRCRVRRRVRRRRRATSRTPSPPGPRRGCPHFWCSTCRNVKKPPTACQSNEARRCTSPKARAAHVPKHTVWRALRSPVRPASGTAPGDPTGFNEARTAHGHTLRLVGSDVVHAVTVW